MAFDPEKGRAERQAFLLHYPLEALPDLKLEQYSNLERADSFTYFLEKKTEHAGSIWGGSSYKFGIYRRLNTDKEDQREAYLTDGEYAWLRKYGEDRNVAWRRVHNLVVQTAKLGQAGRLEEVDEIDLGHAYRWKIAFMYSQEGLLPIYSEKMLRAVAKGLNIPDAESLSTPALHRAIYERREPDEDVHQAAMRLLQTYVEKEDGDGLSENDIPILSTEEWLPMLSNRELIRSSDLRILRVYLESPNHTNQSHKVDAILKGIPETESASGAVNGAIGYAAKRVLTALPQDLNIPRRHSGNPVYWRLFFIGEKQFHGYPWTLRPELVRALQRINLPALPDHNKPKNITVDKSIAQPLNQILYGPPGTGKTYATIEKAVTIINPAFDLHQDRHLVQAEFRRLQDEGRIGFTTFHQSMSYEDFVEGIKPVLRSQSGESSDADDQLLYVLQPGIFREMVTAAEAISSGKTGGQRLLIDKKIINKAGTYKVSLGETASEADQEIYRFCLENDCIAIGYGEDIDFTNADSEAAIKEKFKQAEGIDESRIAYGFTAIKCLKLWMQVGDLVFVSAGTQLIRAVGLITGDYYFDPNTSIRFSQFRPVKWLYKDIKYPIKKLYGKQFSMQTIYGMRGNELRPGLLREHDSNTDQSSYVLIIDEINRGNVSRIFGELITLLEPDKRLGQPEALTVTLPYSRESFGVPPNLYIMGTMNTADRSVVALDAALRRRFRFVEVPPDPAIFDAVEGVDRFVAIHGRDFDLSAIMRAINGRVEMLRDRDHRIGHSYFLKMTSAAAVAEQFHTGIIPLLREYFYEDYAQLQLVLGSGFVAEEAGGRDVKFPTGAKTGNLDRSAYHRYQIIDHREDLAGLAAALSVLLGENEPDAA